MLKRNTSHFTWLVWVVLPLSILQTSVCVAQKESDLSLLKKLFAHPPDSSRIMMRWWWFGPAVAKPEIRRELEQMKSVGIGGVEIATLYPLVVDDSQRGLHNITPVRRASRCSPVCCFGSQTVGAASGYYARKRMALRRSAYSCNPGCRSTASRNC